MDSNTSPINIATSLECCFNNMDGEDCCSSCSFCSYSRDTCYRMLLSSTINCISNLQSQLSRVNSILDYVVDDINLAQQHCKVNDLIS